MNLRPFMRPYTTLHTRKPVLMIIRVHDGTRSFIRSLGQSCVAESGASIVFDGVEEKKRQKDDVQLLQ